VLQQVLNGDLLDGGAIGLAAEGRAQDAARAENGVVQRQKSIVDQAEDGHRGEGLGKAGDAEEVIDADGVVLRGIGQAVALGKDEAALVHDGQ
jgi:hypothetical protein